MSSGRERIRMLHNVVKIYAFSFWVLGTCDNHLIHTFLFIHFPTNYLQLYSYTQHHFYTFYTQWKFHLLFLFEKIFAQELSTSLPPLQNVCAFSVKGCLGFSESKSSSCSPNLSPCLPSDQSDFLLLGTYISCIFNLPLSTSSVYRHIFLVPP